MRTVIVSRVRIISLLMLFSMLSSLLLPFVGGMTMGGMGRLLQIGDDIAANTDVMRDMYGDKILICTAQGYRWLDVKPQGSSSSQPIGLPQIPAHAPAHDCSYCLLTAQGFIWLTNHRPTSIVRKVIWQDLAYIAPPIAMVRPWAHQPQHSRAPPASHIG